MRVSCILILCMAASLFSFSGVFAQCTVDIWNPYGEYVSVPVGATFPLYFRATGCGAGFAYTITVTDQYGGIIDISTGVMNSDFTYHRTGTTVYPLGLHTATIVLSVGGTDSTHYYVLGGGPYPTYPPYTYPPYTFLPYTPVPAMLDAEAGPARTVSIGEQVLFDGSGSVSSNPITSYVWDFGDGESGYGKTVSHVYARAGSFTATLSIIDSRGATAKDTAQITVRSPYLPPVARIRGETAVRAQTQVSFDGSGSTDADGVIVSFNWDFGDGSQASGAVVRHLFAHAGSFTVTLTVTDNGGLSSRAQNVISVAAPRIPPRAVIGMPGQVFAGEAVMLSASLSQGEGLAYRWSFGDGTGGEGSSAMHVYRTAGSYIVSLTVTDGEGSSDTAQLPLTVAQKSLFGGGNTLLVGAGILIITVCALLLLVFYFARH